MNLSLQQSKIMRLAKTSRNRFTFDGAKNVESDESDSSKIFSILFLYLIIINQIFFEKSGEDNAGGKGGRGGKGPRGGRGGKGERGDI